MRFLPKSLLGQVMLAMAVALLVAQAISATLLYRAAEQRREATLLHAAAFQLIAGSRRADMADGNRDARTRPPRVRWQGADGPRLPRQIRYRESDTTPLVAGDQRSSRRETELGAILAQQGIAADEIVVATRPFLSDPQVIDLIESFPRARSRLREMPRDLMVVGLRREDERVWQIARIAVPPRDRAFGRTLVVQTLIQFLVLVGLLYFVLRRITRPLAVLADRTQRFSGAGAPEEPLTPSGPQDVRRLIDAHNAMQARIGSMLDEKDVMLGAIGHDLKTPLSALRVRIESVEDEVARGKMADTIEEITLTLDEILILARVGRGNSAPEPTELGALAASVVEEFEDLGQPVTLESHGRLAAPVQLTWLKRGLRNLVTNALRYAGAARVTVLRDGHEAVLRVEDDGPGIPEDLIAAMMEPFTRGEASRNRETGGAGLGLTLARAVAEQHGGTLVLTNRPEGGLRADIRLPL